MPTPLIVTTIHEFLARVISKTSAPGVPKTSTPARVHAMDDVGSTRVHFSGNSDELVSSKLPALSLCFDQPSPKRSADSVLSLFTTPMPATYQLVSVRWIRMNPP